MEVPSVICDFIFDLHSATRQSLRLQEVSQVYEIKYKELSDKYFAQSIWPEGEAVASEFNNDPVFLIFYKEMTCRHLFTKVKPQMHHFVQSWATYNKLFEFILSAPEPEIALSNQWVADIVQEYAYQFQGFCQYRTQLGLRTPEELQLLEANRDIWVLPVVLKTLQDLYISGKQMNNQPEPHYVLSFFSCFASVELARVECLVGDYSTSLQSLSPAILGSRIDLISQIPTCHVNVYYHAGVAQLMLKRHIEALDTFSDVILAFISSIKATPGHRGGNTPLVKTLDKILFLLTVTYALSPGYRINEQVKELVESKLGEKYRKLISGDVSLMSEMFEGACPKFVCSVVPNYSVIENLNQEAFSNQATLFTKDAGQLLSILKIRSYLRVYKSIELSKVARMTGVSEEEITSQLQSLKQRTMQYSSSTDGTASTRVSISDVQFSLVDNVLMIEEDTRNSKNESAERFFKSSTRKHIDIMNDMNRIFRQYGL